MSEPQHNGGGPTSEALSDLRRQAEDLARRIDALAATEAPSIQKQPRLSVLASHEQPEVRAAGQQDDPAPAEAPEEPKRRGVRLADLPSPVARHSPWRRVVFWLIALALVAGAFLAGYFWTDLEQRIRTELGVAPATTAPIPDGLEVATNGPASADAAELTVEL